MTTLTFQNTALSVINKNNQSFLTSSELGKALQYANPLQSVTNLYNSNADEFTPEMTALIEMQTAGGKQQVRIFSLRGAHLIAMFARTKVAKEFRRWVLDILDKEVSQNSQQNAPLATATLTPAQQQQIQASVTAAHNRTGLSYNDIYGRLKHRFQVAKYSQITQAEFTQALAFLQNINRHTPALPSPNTICVDENHYQTLVHLARTASSATAHLMEQQQKALEAFGFAFSPISGNAILAKTVEEMQFVIDEAEANFRRHIRRNTF